MVRKFIGKEIQKFTNCKEILLIVRKFRITNCKEIQNQNCKEIQKFK